MLVGGDADLRARRISKPSAKRVEAFTIPSGIHLSKSGIALCNSAVTSAIGVCELRLMCTMLINCGHHAHAQNRRKIFVPLFSVAAFIC